MNALPKWNSYTPARLHARLLGFKYIATDPDKRMYGFKKIPYSTRYNAYSAFKNLPGGDTPWYCESTKYNPLERTCIGIYTGTGKWQKSIRKV